MIISTLVSGCSSDEDVFLITETAAQKHQMNDDICHRIPQQRFDCGFRSSSECLAPLIFLNINANSEP
jgi:hypothetical protein